MKCYRHCRANRSVGRLHNLLKQVSISDIGETMSEKLNQLKEKLGEVDDIGKAASVLGWDQQVNMPPGGNEVRGQQLATLSKIAQEKFISEEVGRLIDDLKQEFDGADTDEA